METLKASTDEARTHTTDGAQQGRIPVAATPTADCSDDAHFQDLISRIVRQDEKALTELYRVLIGRVYSLALRVVRDAPTAEEVAEDTFWQVWRQAARFDRSRGTALSWIMTVARSRSLDALRARGRAMANIVSVDTRAGALESESDARGSTSAVNAQDLDGARMTDPQLLVSGMQESHLLQQCLKRLEPASRELVDLAFFSGLTHDEIVHKTGLPLGTVKSRIRRALGSLRCYLAPLEEADREPVAGGLSIT